MLIGGSGLTAQQLPTVDGERRLYALSAWRETPFFSGRERAALAFTEAVTLVAGAHDALDAAVEEAAAHFDPQELIRLLYLVMEINAFNRQQLVQPRFIFDRADAKAAMALLRQEKERQRAQREIALDPSKIERSGGERNGP